MVTPPIVVARMTELAGKAPSTQPTALPSTTPDEKAKAEGLLHTEGHEASAVSVEGEQRWAEQSIDSPEQSWGTGGDMVVSGAGQEVSGAGEDQDDDSDATLEAADEVGQEQDVDSDATLERAGDVVEEDPGGEWQEVTGGGRRSRRVAAGMPERYTLVKKITVAEHFTVTFGDLRTFTDVYGRLRMLFFLQN